MDELVIGGITVGIIVLALILVLVFVSTHNRSIYRRFHDPVETVGRVEDISRRGTRYVNSDYMPEPYIVTYSYFDGYGSPHAGSFLAGTRKAAIPMDVGDRINVYYDRQNPDNVMTEFQLKAEKAMWWKIPLALAVIILPVVIIVVLTR